MFVDNKKRLWQILTGVIFAIIVGAFMMISWSAWAEPSRVVSLGLAKSETSAGANKKHMVETGLTGHSTVFCNLLSSSSPDRPCEWVKESYLETGIKDVVLTLVIKAPLERIAGGGVDKELKALARMIRKGRRHHYIIRPLHEGDGNWYQWGMYYPGNTPELYAKAFVHVATVLKGNTDKGQVTIEANFNRRDSHRPPGPLTEIDSWFSKIDPVVDMYAISSYNRCGTADNYKEEKTFAEEFGPAYEKLAERTDKPINVAEVATSGLCGVPKLQWYVDMLQSVEDQFPQVKMVTFLFGKVESGVASNEVEVNWGFPTTEEEKGFAYFVHTWEERMRNR
jgi:hypothetical protein